MNARDQLWYLRRLNLVLGNVSRHDLGTTPMAFIDPSSLRPAAVAGYRGDGGGLGEEATPSVAGPFRFIPFGVSCGRQPVLAQGLPVSHRIVGAREGRKTRVMFFGTTRRPVVCQPARSRRSTAWRAPLHTARDLDEVELHRLAVGVGHGERRAGAARRADGTEQVGAFVALIGGLRLAERGAHRRTRPFFWPMRASSWNHISFGLPFRQAGAGDVQRRGWFDACRSPSLAGWRGRALTCEKPSCLRILPIVRSGTIRNLCAGPG